MNLRVGAWAAVVLLAGCQSMQHQRVPIQPVNTVKPVPVEHGPAVNEAPPQPATSVSSSVSEPMVIRAPAPMPAPVHNHLADGRDIPAVRALLAKAAALEEKGDLDNAAMVLERTQRLAPQSAGVYQELASIRLRQNRLPEAEQMARKGLAFANSNSQQAVFWRLIATAAERQGRLDVSLQAKAKAAQLEAQGDRS